MQRQENFSLLGPSQTSSTLMSKMVGIGTKLYVGTSGAVWYSCDGLSMPGSKMNTTGKVGEAPTQDVVGGKRCVEIADSPRGEGQI